MPTEDAQALVLRLLEESGALRRGHYQLSSGLHSSAYVQCALLLQDARRARRVAEELAARLAPHAPRAVLSPALGGLIIGHEVAAALGVPFRFCERQGAAMALRRGFSLAVGEPVAVVEDVVTTGKSTRETAELASARGARVVAVGALLDRSSGGHGFAVPFEALARLELPTWAPDSCPLCQAGIELDRPGSRPGSRPG